MKKIAKLLCLLLIGALLLTGCDTGLLGDIVDMASDEVKEKTFTNAGVTMTLTTKFLDFTSTTEEYDFMYACEDFALFGVQDPKADLADFGELDAKSYGELISELYVLDAAVEEKDGKYTLSYEVEDEDGKLTFVCLFLETEDAFWLIQASSPSDLYEANKDQLWTWLSSSTIQ